MTLDKRAHKRIETYIDRISSTNGFIILDRRESKTECDVALMQLSSPLEKEVYDSPNDKQQYLWHDLKISGTCLKYDPTKDELEQGSFVDMRANWGDILITGPDEELFEEFRTIVPLLNPDNFPTLLRNTFRLLELPVAPGATE